MGSMSIVSPRPISGARWLPNARRHRRRQNPAQPQYIVIVPGIGYILQSQAG
jgi:hypothetical protein